jgi:hypothetical protein
MGDLSIRDRLRLRALRRQAERERVPRAGQSAAPEEPSRGENTVVDPDSYAVFKKIVPGGRVFLCYPTAIVLLPCAAVLLLILFEERGFLLLGMIPVLALGQVFGNRIRYRFYKKWQEKLPYSLAGWVELVRAKAMHADLCWTDLAITVETRERSCGRI